MAVMIMALLFLAVCIKLSHMLSMYVIVHDIVENVMTILLQFRASMMILPYHKTLP